MSDPASAADRSPSSVDRNLLFGVLALQLEVIDDRQFAQACSAWATSRDTPLADVLRDLGWLNDDDRREVERLVERKLKRHGGDVRRSLATAADSRARDVLQGVGDDAVRKSLDGLSPGGGYVLMQTV